MKEQNKSLLADKIAGILNSAPSSIDPENDVLDETTAQVLDENIVEEPEEREVLSEFRRATVDLLADLDEKYAGKKTSRKDLKDSESEDDETVVEGSQANSSEDDVEDENDTYEENEEESKSEEESEIEESDYDGDFLESDSKEDSNFKQLPDTNVSQQIQKGLCVRNQMAMWEHLLEIRIQLQKCLITANKMPNYENFKEIKQSGSEFLNKTNETKRTLSLTLEKLLEFQKLVLKQYPETKNLAQKEAQKAEDEIASETDEETHEEDDEEEPKKKKRKLLDYEIELSSQDKLYKDYRNKVIQKWNDKTRVVVKNSSTASHSILDQINFNLSNREKLIKRTQLKRSEYDILGEDKEAKSKEENVEIFDDDDFYHQLLRELIEVKSSDVTDPVQLGRQWIHLQNLRTKMKRKVDTRATKGRKIRYAVHSKLVNFMAPIEENSWTYEAKNELYNSLFGKNIK